MRILCVGEEAKAVAAQLADLTLAGTEVRAIATSANLTDAMAGCERLAVVRVVRGIEPATMIEFSEAEAESAAAVPDCNEVFDAVAVARGLGMDAPKCVCVFAVRAGSSHGMEHAVERLRALASAKPQVARPFALCRMDACYCCVGPSVCTETVSTETKQTGA